MGAVLITAALYERDLTEIAPLPNSTLRTWLEEISDTGAFSFTLQNDDPTLADITRGRYVRFQLDGDDTVTGIIEPRVKTSVDPSEEINHSTLVKGRLVGALLERAVLHPSTPLDTTPSPDTRFFNFASIAFDDSGWDPSIELGTFTNFLGFTQPTYPIGWPPGSTAKFIHSRDYDGDDSMPEGTSYFRTELVVGGTDPVLVAFHIAGDNNFELWVDEILIDNFDTRSNQGWAVTHRKDLSLSPGTYQIAVLITNIAPIGGPSAAANPAYLLFDAWSVDEAINELDSSLLESDASWLSLDYPASPPGFSPGAVVSTLIAEAQNRGTLPNFSITFDDVVDSDGTNWDVTPDITLRVGLDYRSILRQLSETYLEWRVRIDWDNLIVLLDLYVPGGMGTSSSVELGAQVNITRLQHTTGGTLQNALLTRHFHGHSEIVDAASITAEDRAEGFLVLHDVHSGAEVERIANATLEYTATEQTSSDVTYVDLGGARPYADYFLGDALLAPDTDAVGVSQRVMSIQVIEDRDGNLTYRPGVGAPVRPGTGMAASADPIAAIHDRVEAVEQSTKRMINGTLAGRSASAMPGGAAFQFTAGIPPTVNTGRCIVIDAHGPEGMSISNNTRTEVTFEEWATTNVAVDVDGHVIVPKTGWYIETIQAMWAVAPSGSVKVEYGSAGGQPPAASAVVDGYDIDPVGDGRFYFSHGNAVIAYLPEGMELYCHVTQTSGGAANLVHLFLGLAYLCGDTPTIVTVGS